MAQCMICGSEIPEGADACPVCGSAIGATPAGAHRTRDEWVENVASTAGIEVGFSPKFDTPEFQAAMGESNRRSTRTLLIFGVVFPLLPAAICAVSMGPWAFLPTLLLMYLFTIPVVVYFLVKRKTGKTWDGEVIDLIHIEREKGADRELVVCRTDAGKKVSLRDNSGMYSYLRTCDRVRFHPRLNVPLEKYDKTHDTYLKCEVGFSGASPTGRPSRLRRGDGDGHPS